MHIARTLACTTHTCVRVRPAFKSGYSKDRQWCGDRSGNAKFWANQPGASASKTTSLTVLPIGFALKRTCKNAYVQTHTCDRTSHVCTHKFATHSLNLYFQQEVASGDSLLNAIQLIGCFSTCPNHAYVEANMIQPPAQGNLLKAIDNKTFGKLEILINV